MIQPRPPIVVVLGHVDHGKTTLLDHLRRTDIASRETGGITQTTRSFQLHTPDHGTITFIDTPGHAAFTRMRSRGNLVADLAILIVAADDGVMPQTVESVKLIHQASTPYLVAITKSDLPTADPDKVKTQLTEAQVLVEDFGGQIPSVVISAKTGAGIKDLLEMIHLLSSLNPPVADPDGQLEAFVLESRMDSRRGPLATVLIKEGTLHIGQNLFQSGPIGKAKSLTGTDGKPMSQALPSTPVEILGLSAVPPVGSIIASVPAVSLTTAIPVPSNTINTNADLNIILRADVAGSLEAILAALDPKISVISSGTGEVNESDVMLARSSASRIIAFNVKIPASVQKLAEIEKINILTFNLIYELLESLDKIVHPVIQEKVLGKAQIVAEFKINSDRIAGCRCLEGIISKSDQVRLIRSEKVLGTVKIKSLKSGKTEIQSVKSGAEFGALLTPLLTLKPAII